MSALTATATEDGLVPTSRDRELPSIPGSPFDLDVRILLPVSDENLWSMTNDGCGQTCQTACTQSCTQRP